MMQYFSIVSGDMQKEPTINGDEHDWCSGWRRLLCVFVNNTGLGKKVKRAMNKRTRKRAKREIHITPN